MDPSSLTNNSLGRWITRLIALGILSFASGALEAQPAWVQRSPATNPDYREAGAMVWDGNNKQILLFGGCAAAACPSNDTWTWDGTNWTQKLPALSPPARSRPCMLYDSLHKQVVLFGGDGPLGFLNDTWVWDGTNWSQKNSSSAPGDCYASFAYDELHQQAILLTSVSNVSLLSRTWSWDGTNWTLLNPATVPPFSGTALMAYDRARQQLVLETYTDNPNNNNFASTWVWSGSNWIRKAETGKLPFDYNPGQAAYDPVTQQILVVLQGQQTWEWDGSGWFLVPLAISPPSRILPVMAFDELNQQMVLFGGSGSGPSALANDTWTYGFPTLDWSQQAPAVRPTGRAFVGMTFDGKNNNVVLFGGRTTSNVYLGDTWTWNGTAWTQASSSQNPAPRDLPAMAYDAHNQDVVMFGGFGTTGPVGGYFADTWIWSGSNWTLKTPAHSPPAQAFHSMTYDSVNERVVLFSGVTCCSSAVLADTWTWDGIDWTHLTPSPIPPETNAYSVAAFDAARGVTLRYVTAFTSGSYKPSTWTYNGVNWTPLSPSHLPLARILDSSLAYDSQRSQISLFGGSDANLNTYLSDTWLWTGFDWTQIAPPHSPSPRNGFGYAYDPVRNNTVLFGGHFNDATSEAYYDDTWTLSGSIGPSGTTPVTITVPAGVQFTFNGVSYTNSQTINIAPGNYLLATTASQPLAAGAQAVFASWSDGGPISHNVTVASTSLNITGTFTTQYLLTTTSVPAGGGTSNGGGYYNSGTVATVTASSNSGFAFSSWGGACSGSGACSVTMNAPATVTGNFVATSVQFTINVPAGIQFSFYGSTYTGTQSVTLPPGSYPLATTTPQASGAGTQSAFASWSDGGAIAHNVSLTLPVQSVTGVFTTQYLLTTMAAPIGGGAVAPVGAGGPYYNAGAVVTVAEAPNAGYEFDYWSGACAGSAACVVTMNAPKAVVGNFSTPMKWVQLGPVNTPPGREYAASAYDSARGEMVLFGGEIGDFDVLANDTWTWSGTNWTQKTPATSPSPRRSPAMAYDPVHGQTVMFGGLVATGGGTTAVNAETWIWDGTNWIQKSPANSPVARLETQMAWDGSRLILFGGLGKGTVFQDTWAWDGTNWTLLNPASHPSGRFSQTMTYDAARNQIMLFGGDSGIRLNDTWVWTGTNWVQQNPATPPPPRELGVAAYDAVVQQTLLFSGFTVIGNVLNVSNDLWLWDGAQWKQQSLSPSPLPQFAETMAYDEGHQQVVLYGGNNNNPAIPIRRRETWVYASNATQQFFTPTIQANPLGAGVFATSYPGQPGPAYRAGSEVAVTATATSPATAAFQYWTGDCTGQPNPCYARVVATTNVIGNFIAPPRWIQIGPVNTPPGRRNSGLVFDSSRGESVFFGGVAEATGTESNETWTWDGSNWTMKHPPSSPSPREGHGMIFDPAHNVVVLFGGAGNLASTILYGDTWIWNGAAGTWNQVSPAHAPTARSGARMEWDGNRVILFGGQTSTGASAETWAWNGSDWTQLTPANSPPARAYGSVTFDSIRKQIVLFGGENAGPFTGLLGDTWIWDGVNWTQLSSTGPAPRTRAVMAFHGLIQKAVLFSGDEATVSIDTWLWDGSNWALHAEPVSPDFQFHSAMTYDAARQQIVLLAHYAGDLRETWFYANNAVQQFGTVTAVANPTTGGTVSGGGTFRLGTNVFLSETPAPGYEFQGWSGGCSGSQRLCGLSLMGNVTVTANFGYPLSWLKLNPGTNASPNDSLFFENPASMAYDSTRKQIVYFGGTGGAQTWIWNGTTWTLRAPAHSPTPRAGAALAYDEARQATVLFGGATSAGVTLNDTWTWDGIDWTQRSTPTAPSIRANHSMAYDRARQEVILFGGWDYNGQFLFRTDTWAWNGSAWTLRATTGPGGRSDFGLAYDAANQQLVMSPAAEGGTDTWTWNGTSWTLADNTLPGAIGGFRAMAYDERLQRTIMVVEYAAAVFQTWSWNGANWTQLAPLQSPAARSGAGLAYDGVRGQILLFGGDLASGSSNETWVLSPPTVVLTPQSFSALKDASGNYLVTMVLKNAGSTPANIVFAQTATLGATTSFTFTSPQFITIAIGASTNITAKFPASVGAGAHPFSISGGYSYTGGSTGLWSAASRAVVLP